MSYQPTSGWMPVETYVRICEQAFGSGLAMKHVAQDYDGESSNRRMTRSACKKKKFEDDFSNRRMTRSASKLQQPQQPHGEGKEQKKKKKKESLLFQPYRFVGDVIKKERPYKIVDFTKEERLTYKRVVKETDGFGCLYVPPHASVPGLLVPLNVENAPDEALKDLHDWCKLAIKRYNEEEEEKERSYQFVKIIRANLCFNGKAVYHITFQAQDHKAGSTLKNFQALVSTFIPEVEVVFCRVEQESKPPELALKGVKKSNKLETREGDFADDISGGRELFPVCVENTIDDESPPTFNYMTEMKYPDWCFLSPPKGCDCIGGCSNLQKCSCLVKNGGEIPYDEYGTIFQKNGEEFPYHEYDTVFEAKPLVYECGPSCKCPPSCYNRVSQHGIDIKLNVFKTKSNGWGVRSGMPIRAGMFVCEYIGELIDNKEAGQRHNDEYLFDTGKNYSDCCLADGLSNDEVLKDVCFTIDATRFGNVARFINRSCSPNLYAQNVLYDHKDKNMPHIMLFAAKLIPPYYEMTL